MRQRRLILGILVTATVALAAAVAPAFGVSSAAKVVKLKNIKFSPSRVVIAKGQSVTWEFLDGGILTSHNVTSVGRLRFHSSHTMRSGSYTVRFTRTGTYKFMCTLHPASMNGEVIVR
jgi:plastocyanin